MKSIDFLILASLRIEYDAVLRRFDIVERPNSEEALIRVGDTHGVVVCLGFSGRVHAAIVTTRALARWEPKIW
jgi:hypothetical protein